MEFRKPSTIYKKLANGRSFNDKSAYDGVFAAPSKHGTPAFSSGMEDYREIFGGSRGSCIPTLDFPALLEKKLSTDVQKSKLEYSKVFVALEELDFAVPYEEVIDKPKKTDTFSGRPLTPAGRVFPAVGKDSSTTLEQDEVFSHKFQTPDTMKKFNMAYNKVNQGTSNNTKGITHVVQLHPASSYTCMLNDFNQLQANEDGKTGSKVDIDTRDRIKGVGSTRDTQLAASLERQTSRTNGFQNKDDWYGNNSIKLKFNSCNSNQGPCSPEPPIFSKPGKSLGYSERSVAPKSEACSACEKAGTLCSPPCFEEEVDINSVAAASVAALRKAIEDAQARIKIAKELMERRKSGLHYRKMGFADKLNGEKKREGGNSNTASRSKDKKLQETCGKLESFVNSFPELRNQNMREFPKVANIKSLSKESTSDQAHCRHKESEVLRKQQLSKLEHAGENEPFENAYPDVTVLKSLQNYELKQNKMAKDTIVNPEEFSDSLHVVWKAYTKEYIEEKIHEVKEKENWEKLKLASEVHFQEAREKRVIVAHKRDETGEKVKVSYEKEKHGRREKVNGQESTKDDKKFGTQELDENSVKKEIKVNEWIDDEMVKRNLKQNENDFGEKVEMSYERENSGKRIEDYLEGTESISQDKNLESKRLVENSVMRQMNAHDWIEDEKVKLDFKQVKNGTGEKVQLSYEKENCQERLGDHLEGQESLQEDEKLAAREVEEHTVKEQVKAHEWIEDEKIQIISEQDINEIKGKVRGEDTDEKYAQVYEPDIVEDCINDFQIGGETKLKENGECQENKKHPKIDENEEMVTDLSHQIEENEKICEPFEGKRIHLKLDRISETEIETTQDGLNFFVGKLEVTDDVCNWNTIDITNKYERAYESLDHGEVEVEGASNHPLCEDSQNNSNHPLCEDSRNKMEVVKASVEAKRTEKELDENASLKAPFLTEDTVLLEEVTSEMESSNEVEELTKASPSDPHEIDFDITDVEFGQTHVKEHDNDFTTETYAEEFDSKVEEVHKCVKGDEVVNNVRFSDDEGLLSSIDNLSSCFFPRRMSEEIEATVIAEETITGQYTTTVENHQASETVKDCYANDIFEEQEEPIVNNSGQDPQSDIHERKSTAEIVLENKKSQVRAINDENHQVTITIEDKEIRDTMNHGQNRMESDWPPLSEKEKFIEKTQEGETNQNVIANEEKHQTTQTVEEVEINDALQNEARLEPEVNFPSYARTCGMDGVDNCFEIEEDFETDNSDDENEEKQQIVPPQKVEHGFERSVEVENGHQGKSDEAKEIEKGEKQSGGGTEQKHQIKILKEGTQTNHKFERLLEVENEYQRKTDEAKEREKENEQGDLENEQKQQTIPPKEGTQTKHQFERLAEAEKEHQRKIDEVKEKEKEKDRERIAVERAIREARERAYSEARERVVAERDSAQTRLREKTSPLEHSGKTSIEGGNNKIGAERASIEAKIRAERNAVERATAEARERALEKALSKKAFSEAKNLAEKLVEEKLSNTSRDSARRSDLLSNYKDTFASTSSGNSNVREPSENSNGSIGETAQRHKTKLEKHQRTVERVAKALAERNIRDLLAQKEQAERNRFAESLDADVKRWSSGKEGNLRLLLTTLQYILGPDNGWQPIPLTDIIAPPAVKKAYRKATLLVHPDKLQQRGATIQQKYICEKVFDLLKAAWNRFNAEER